MSTRWFTRALPANREARSLGYPSAATRGLSQADTKSHFRSIDNIGQLINQTLQLSSNRFFTANASFELAVGKGNEAAMDLDELQKLGVELGSSLTKTLPADEILVAMAKQLLGI